MLLWNELLVTIARGQFYDEEENESRNVQPVCRHFTD
jgi:hypothetical protein